MSKSKSNQEQRCAEIFTDVGIAQGSATDSEVAHAVLQFDSAGITIRVGVYLSREPGRLEVRLPAGVSYESEHTADEAETVLRDVYRTVIEEHAFAAVREALKG
jgi:hypothetical protein